MWATLVTALVALAGVTPLSSAQESDRNVSLLIKDPNKDVTEVILVSETNLPDVVEANKLIILSNKHNASNLVSRFDEFNLAERLAIFSILTDFRDNRSATSDLIAEQLRKSPGLFVPFLSSPEFSKVIKKSDMYMSNVQGMDYFRLENIVTQMPKFAVSFMTVVYTDD